MKSKRLIYLSCAIFGLLYLLVSVISLVCSTEFFGLAHGGLMSWALAIGFELGAMACLVSTFILPKEKLGLVWIMFIILTLFQMMGNSYMAYISLKDYAGWVEMFGLVDSEPIFQKRVLAILSGAILPLVALGFIRILVMALSSPAQTRRVDDTEENSSAEKRSAEDTKTAELKKDLGDTADAPVPASPVKETKKASVIQKNEPTPVIEGTAKDEKETAQMPETSNTDNDTKSPISDKDNTMEQHHSISPRLQKPPTEVNLF